MDDRGHVICVAKSLSDRTDPASGILRSLAVAAEQMGIPVEVLPEQTRLLIPGCTVDTNAMIERSGAVTGPITTRGHEDAIIIGKVSQKVAGLSEREIVHQSQLPRPTRP